MAFLYPRLAIRNHTYYIRVSVPKALIPLVKRKNFFYSLQTKDYFEALYKVREESVKIDKILLEAQNKMLRDKNGHLFLDDKDIEKVLITRWIEVLDATDKSYTFIKLGKKTFADFAFFKPDNEEYPFPYVYEDEEDANGNIVEVKYPVLNIYEHTDLESGQYRVNPPFETQIRLLKQFITKVLKLNDAEWNIPEIRKELENNAVNYGILNGFDFKNEEDNDTTYNFIKLLNWMKDTDLEVKRYIKSLVNGTTYSPEHPYIKKLFNTAQKQREQIDNSFSIKHNLDELVEDWRQYKLKRNEGKNVGRDVNRVKIMFNLIKVKDVKKLTLRHIKKLEEMLIKFPKNYAQKYQDNYDLFEAIKLVEDGKAEAITHSTVRDSIMTFHTFLDFLRTEKEIISANVAANYKFRFATKKKEPYVSFSDDDLKKIFNPATYFPQNIPEHIANFWCSLIALTTGCCLNEVAQLDTEDIFTIDGIPCIQFIKLSFHDSESKKSLKNEHRERTVPIPDIILKLKFLEYVERRTQLKKDKLFDLNYNKSNGYGDDVGEDFRKYTKLLGVYIYKKKVFHSFRHTFNLFAKNKLISRRLSQSICGWSEDDNSSYTRYGHEDDVPLIEKQQALNSIDWSFLHLEQLLDEKRNPKPLVVKRRKSILNKKK